jgi:hypothetical protein
MAARRTGHHRDLAVHHSYPMVDYAKGHSAGHTVEETLRWRSGGKHYVGHGQ